MPSKQIEVAPPPDAPRFVHLGHDSIFLASFSRYMEEVAPGCNDYIVVAPPSGLKNAPSGHLKIAASSEAEAQAALLSSAGDYDVLIIHSMVRSWARILPELHSQMRTVWSGFGGDYYGTTRSPDDGLLGPQTSRLQRELRRDLSLSDRFDKIWFRMLDKPLLRRAARASDFFSAPVSTDFPVFKRRFPSFQGEFAQLNYATAEEVCPPSSSPTGDDILVGNSTSFANNHLEVFEKLGAARPHGRRIVVPLSYGEPAEYREAVIIAGRKQFGSDFTPLLEKLPLNEYTELLSSCSHVVMGHQRQQALGNVITALLGGATLILDPRNPIYQFLHAEGARIGSLTSLPRTSLEELTLSSAEQEQNRQIAHQVWSKSTVLQNLRTFIMQVTR